MKQFNLRKGDMVRIGDVVIEVGRVRVRDVKIAVDAPAHVNVVRMELVTTPQNGKEPFHEQ